MLEYIYNIVLQTQLGHKYGKLRLTIEQGKISGFFDILQKSEPCNGTVDENGFCKLNGRIITLMNEIDFTATGYVDSEKIKLTLYNDKENFLVTGTACHCLTADEWRQ